mmetsp:Transcript_12132/g.25041  ORF Transcript_12132/g.25041 Transcript_12132/m.25041 type:complete len:511 (-) Transcript_12132:1733-3265(-)
MTTNFERVSVDPEPNKRIGIGDGDNSYCENRLTRGNDRIDSRWPLSVSVASNLVVENGVAMAPSTQTLPSLPTQELQRQLDLLKTDRMPLTLDNTTLAFLPASLAVPKHNNNKTVGDSLCSGKPLSPSPTSVISKKVKEPPADVKMEVAFSRQSGNYANPLHQNYEREENQHQNHPMQTEHQPNHHQLQHQQLQNQPQYKLDNLQQEYQLQKQQQQNTLQNQHQQPQNPLQEYPLQNQQQHCQHPNEFQQEIEFDCLHPRDDHRSRVRFSQSLSVYDNFEDFDYSDADCSPQSTTRKMMGMNKENNECKLMFMLQRAIYCWYSRGELTRIKSERKEIVRALRRVNFDVGSIDQSMYELRGLEAYLSPDAIRTTLKKRRETLERVFTEQGRQRQSEDGRRDPESIQMASSKGSEWFRTRAREVAERDANEALDLYLYDAGVVRLMSKSTTTPSIMNCFRQNSDRCTVDESLHEPFGFMEVEEDNTGDGVPNDSTLTFWANSSWAERNLMEE